MITNIRAWGNSQGVYIPKKLLAEADISVNDPVDLSVADGTIMIRKGDRSDMRAKALESLRAIRARHAGDKIRISDDYRKEIEEYLDEKYGQ